MEYKRHEPVMPNVQMDMINGRSLYSPDYRKSQEKK